MRPRSRSHRRTGAPSAAWTLRAGVRLCACALVFGCASAGDPPGGPPDEDPPEVVGTEPESGSVVTDLPDEASIVFNEVVNERVAGNPSDITGAVLLSPAAGEVKVGWHRDRITARPRGGFVAGRIYRLELLPVLTDLRQNRLREGRLIVFSTGPEIPTGRLWGAVVDWVAGRPAPRALVEALLLPDSLPYRTLTDSTGSFDMPLMPAGTYRVYGIMDTNNDRRRGAREAYDTVTVTLAADSSPALAELWAFPHDTLGPRIRQVELGDSLTIKVTFDRPLAPGIAIDTARVTLALESDSATRLPVAAVLTQIELDSLRARERRTADSVRAATDTTRAAPEIPAAPGRQGAAVPARPGVRGAARPPLDSTRAEKMAARRPAPTDARLVRLAAPLEPGTRYTIAFDSVEGLAGARSSPRGQLRTPLPRPATERRGTPADSAAPRDSAGVRDSAAVRDSGVTRRRPSARDAARADTALTLLRP